MADADVEWLSFTDQKLGTIVRLRKDKIFGYSEWYPVGAKLEDRPIGCLLYVEGVQAGVLVSESREVVRAKLGDAWHDHT